MDWTHEQIYNRLDRLLIMVGDINRMLKTKIKNLMLSMLNGKSIPMVIIPIVLIVKTNLRMAR